MKALVYHGPGQRSWEEKPKPVINEPTDAIVKIAKTTICGTDLHILKGDVPTVTDGRILGHEGVGIIEEVGPGVTNFKKGNGCCSRALLLAANAMRAKRECTLIARVEGGSSGIPSMGRRRNT